MDSKHLFRVAPRLPERLHVLEEMAYDLTWSWDSRILSLFRRLDPDLWERVYHNPVLLLGQISQDAIEAAAHDDVFIAHMEKAYEIFKFYTSKNTWFKKKYSDLKELTVGYFSMEYGLTECLHIYSGGLGLLAGDHLKSASELGIPLSGVGLFYQQGYFQQYLNPDGWQQERYPKHDFYNLPVQMVKDADGNPLKIDMDLTTSKVSIQVWRVQISSISLYLLDTNLPENSEEDRRITDQLYGGDIELRLKQEIILGIGGIRALDAMGIRPSVCHINEGHAAYLSLERIRQLLTETPLSFFEALYATKGSNIFTTHTPVPAGFDIFSSDLLKKYLTNYIQSLGISFQEFLKLGHGKYQKKSEGFSMADLALNTCHYVNAVSKLHRCVSKDMWKEKYKELTDKEIPIDSVTNGIHTKSWISQEMFSLFERYLGDKWIHEPENEQVWERIAQIPDPELWGTHERRKERLVAFCRKRLIKQLTNRGAPATDIEKASEVLNPHALTIGFARRFATYKRAALIFSDVERLKRILCHPDKPVQLIFAGKAHPKDNEGKQLIKTIQHFSRSGEFGNKIIFLENYDINVARYLVQGVNVWLNNPRIHLEASGTSGMKVAVNGGLNCSIPDGWWAEAYDGTVGWVIGAGEQYDNYEYQDSIESTMLYDLLENEIVPLFYNRGSDGIPREWVAKMKTSMAKLSCYFNTYRMVQEYTEKFYLNAYGNWSKAWANEFATVKAFYHWKKKIKNSWNDVAVVDISEEKPPDLFVGDTLLIKARIKLGKLKPEDVAVQVYYGPLNQERQITDGEVAHLTLQNKADNDTYLYQAPIPCNKSGMQGYAARIVARNSNVMLYDEIPRLKWE